MRLLSCLAAVGALCVGCSNDKTHAHPDQPDARVEDPYWMPAVGDGRNYDVQVNAPYNFATARTMYLVDLFDVVPQTTMMGDVSVPAGAQATALDALHAAGTKVMCRVALGTIRLTDPDASKYPGYAASPPDRPDAVAAGSVVGWSTSDADERWLDLTKRTQWEALAYARIAFAKTIGCDGVEVYHADYFGADTGFAEAVSGEMQIAWFSTLAAKVHAETMSAGVNGFGEIYFDGNAQTYDWLVTERCGEQNLCETVKPFLSQHKAVFAIDYQTDLDGNALDATTMCARQSMTGIMDGVIKDTALSSTFTQNCSP